MKPYTKITIGNHKTDLHEKIRIAIGHMAVDVSDVEKSFLGTPNISPKRFKKLSQLFNDVIRHGVTHSKQHVHLLILPEVSLPHSWATFVARWAREHQIGVICGLEHRVDKYGKAWNELLAALPYRTKNGTKACVPIRRLKQHYSPDEEFKLNNNDLGVPKVGTKSQYQLFQWRGSTFAVYNCFELACLEDRALFKSRIDFLVCSEFNPDVNYFSNIVEAASRDLHCFIVQVNSAQFGDSRVVSPSKTEKLNPLRIKGGDNQTFLTIELPLQKLRIHQSKKYGLQKESEDYKPTPPGYKRKYVKERIMLGQSLYPS